MNCVCDTAVFAVSLPLHERQHQNAQQDNDIEKTENPSYSLLAMYMRNICRDICSMFAVTYKPYVQFCPHNSIIIPSLHTLNTLNRMGWIAAASCSHPIQ